MDVAPLRRQRALWTRTPATRSAGATATSYTATSADRGKRLRVMLTVRNEDGTVSAISGPQRRGRRGRPRRGPPRTPTPDADRHTRAGVTAPTRAAPHRLRARGRGPGGAVLDKTAAAPRLMRPMPVVRIGGRLTRSGARITLLTVRAPRGASITVRCIGRGCPARRWAHTASLRASPASSACCPRGTKLVITVTKPGRIGKHTTIVIRRGKAPTRRDRCLMPGTRKPVRCPAV